MGLKQGYKQTEIGVIPEDWEIHQLGEICQYQNGTSLEQFFNSEEGFSVISIGNYSPSGHYIDNKVYISHQHKHLIQKFVLNENDLTMILNDKTSKGTIIGRVLLIEQDNQYVFNQRTMRLTPKENILSKYLYYVINSENIHETIVGLAKPGTQIYVNTNDVTELRIPLPPTLREQQAIADALSDVDAELSALDALIAKKRDIKQGAMQDLLTGQTRLSGFGDGMGYKQTEVGVIPEDWEVKPLGQHVSISSGQSPSRFELLDSGVPFFKVEQLNNSNKYQVDTPYFIQMGSPIMAGSLIFPKRGASILLNKIRILKQDSFMDTNLMTLTTTETLSNEYLYYALLKIELWRVADTTSIPQINNKHINPLLIPVPSISEQKAIANILSDLDDEITLWEYELTKIQTIKQGMMQELLTGKTRLV
jgi:type I restriction enzyme, S subunit